ncbi:MAG: hypothetical protein ABIH36_02575 [bacterium]
MRGKLAASILVGVIWAGAALADEDFGEDDFYEPQEQEIVVPERRQTVAAPVVEVEGLNELPFEPLDKSLDGDRDGLSDVDEVRLATDANNPDTDGDGYIDGLEVVRGYNPLKASPGDKVVMAELDTASPSDVYKITGVRLNTLGIKNTLVVTGVGPPNSLVTLLVFSEEMKTWVARSDSSGRFIYVSEDTLGIGQHRIYAAGTAAGGAVLAVSSPLVFIREADSLEMLEEKAVPEPIVVGSESSGWLFLAAGTSILSMAAIIGGGLVLWRRTR